LCNLAGNVQDTLLLFLTQANAEEAGCLSREIKVDGYMILFYDESTWKKFVDVFDILGFDFTTGEPDYKYNTWYIDFEFSDGISR
jgi:hypothetical protein